MVPRGGVKLGTLSELQRVKLDRLLGELLSEDGVKNITYQLAAEDMLVSEDGFDSMKYGSEYYYAAFLGEPSTTEPWMFQFGGAPSRDKRHGIRAERFVFADADRGATAAFAP